MNRKQTYQWVGSRPIRPDGIDKVTGKAEFAADFSLPGMLHGVILRSPVAHARILRIDTALATALPGVKAIITAADMPVIPEQDAVVNQQPPDFRELSDNLMARDKVLYEGHAVAAVAATSRELALQAAQLIQVEYEVLPHVIDVRLAMEPDAPLLNEQLITKGIDPAPEYPSNIASRHEQVLGDVTAGFAEAEIILEREFTTQPVHQGYIEPHACTARINVDGEAQIWCSSQGHYMVRAYCARLLRMDISRIRVTPLEIGGGFGGKTTVYLEPIALLLAAKTGKPVTMKMSRQEVFTSTGPASGSYIAMKIGARKDGSIIAAEAILCYQAGAYPGSPVKLGCMTAFAPYRIPNVRMIGYDVLVNRPKSAAYRAPGAPMAAFAAESLIDLLAQELQLDPVALRLLNAAEEGTQAPYGPRFKQIGYRQTLEAALQHPHYSAPLAANQGRGIASGFWFNIGGQSSAAIHLNEDGTAILVTGNPDIGGSRASMAIMAAEVLGMDYRDISPVIADTSSGAYSDLTGGSRVTFAVGLAVITAAEDVIQQLKARAALLWDVPETQISWESGSFHTELQGKPQRMSIADIAAKSAQTGGPVSGKATINAQGAGPGFGTHLCDVEVDPETGQVKILRYTAIQDVGKAIHPAYVEGQLQGGAAQGIGWALNEEYLYDESGKLLNPGFLDYRMPVASDLPAIDTVLVEVPNPAHPFGVRGVGEVPIIAPLAAVANAVARATGVRLTDLPLSPPRILAAIEAAKRSG
ncbi:MAG: xanthine dehydrogenase family protein molybdopterin-binding subunit [Pseudomonadales bacterium]|nr:xanthine dehydrogenase family protein molybdopterin-binding subunit [Pseudomonadales bacterium]